jgi:hypothetical protein
MGSLHTRGKRCKDSRLRNLPQPNTFVFYKIYRSQAAQDFHLQQDFTKKFLATLRSAQVRGRVRTNLVELAPEGQTHSCSTLFFEEASDAIFCIPMIKAVVARSTQ